MQLEHNPACEHFQLIIIGYICGIRAERVGGGEGDGGGIFITIPVLGVVYLVF